MVRSGKKIISNAFDLKERLFIDIINVINQKKRVALNHDQIDDIQYNVLDSAFYFIFDVGNLSQLAIKVPRRYLKNDELPNTKKNIFNRLITNSINQKEGVVLDYALINDIKYNLLDNTFHFIFNVGNPLLKESSQLIVEMPREVLNLENVDRLVEYMLSPCDIYEGSFVYHISEGSYTINLHLIDD